MHERILRNTYQVYMYIPLFIFFHFFAVVAMGLRDSCFVFSHASVRNDNARFRLDSASLLVGKPCFPPSMVSFASCFLFCYNNP